MCPIQEGKGESGVPLEGRVWCASAFPKVESGVPPLEGRVWCALSRRGGGGGGGVWCAISRRGGSGVPSPPNVGFLLY